MLTVNDLLHLKSLEGIKVVAGEQGLNKPISIVNIMENPDAFDWLTPNELLLSTGYIFKDNEDLQNRIIKELTENNCSGLCIKIRRYFDQIPQNMIDCANKYGFPILALPFEYPLSKVIQIINEKATGKYDLINRKTLDIHNTLFNIALKGGGIERISSALSETIHNPIIYLDSDWNLLHYTDHKDNKYPLENYLNLVKNRPIFTKEFTDSIPENLSQIKKSIKRMYKTKGLEIKCRILPVAVSNDTYGYIVVWQTVCELSELDYIVLEQASTILALERIKAREIESIKLKIKQDFFDDLLTGKISSSDTIQTLCELHGLNTSYMYYCMIIQIDSIEPEKYEDMVVSKYDLEKKAKKCMNLIYELSNSSDGEINCFYRNNWIIVLMGQNDYRPVLSAREAKLFANELYKVLIKNMKKTTFTIGIGKQYKNITSLHKSFSEAHEAIRMTQQFDGQDKITHFEDYSIYHFLSSNIKTSELESFFLETLGKIKEYDRIHGSSLMITLENYFMFNKNIRKASEAMFIHRNTFIYRIEKIKEILNTELKDPEELLKLQLSLKIFRLLTLNQG